MARRARRPARGAKIEAWLYPIGAAPNAKTITAVVLLALAAVQALLFARGRGLTPPAPLVAVNLVRLARRRT